jgi:asparaginyl-tRNA synthetase
MFLELRDGTGFIQAIVNKQDVTDAVWQIAGSLTSESSLALTGVVSKHPKKDNVFEMQVKDIQVYQIAGEYPIGKKEHGPDFLMDVRHLWLRSSRQWAILRIRDTVEAAINEYLHLEHFVRTDSPIFTPNACEGTTTLFAVPYFDEGNAYLSQSGQLYIEAAIASVGRCYDFGPVFRAEKSKTRHHLSELWMMDAEMAFHDQVMNMATQERMVKRIVKDVLEHCQEELKILERDTTILQRLVNEPFIHLKHMEAKRILKEEGLITKEVYDDSYWYDDMSTEEEIALGNKYQLPIFIEDYPAEVKAFYMKRFTDEAGRLRARCADLIAPEEGREIIGGSQREESYDKLKQEIIDHNYPLDKYEWYLNTRKYGSVPHAGFGIGLERTVRWICGVHHIRETIAFPRLLNRMEP